MQPVRIGMNSALVLIVLMLAVPLQLFLSHYINSIYGSTGTSAAESATFVEGSSTQQRGNEAPRSMESVRREALDRLISTLSDVTSYVQGRVYHYSKLKSWKELFLVPHKREFVQRRKRKAGGFTLERTLTLDKLARRDDPDSEYESSSSSSSSDSTTGDKGEVREEGNEGKAGAETEVRDEKYMYKNVYFARSKTPRVNRPDHVTLRVGDVVKHTEQGYYGVVVGWDEKAVAPQRWLERYYSDRPHLMDSPNYLVLVDSHYDATGVPFHYLPQDHLELVQDQEVRIQAPEISHFFEGYLHNKHIPRPWLKEIYPED